MVRKFWSCDFMTAIQLLNYYVGFVMISFWEFFFFLMDMSVLVWFWGMSQDMVCSKMQEWLGIHQLVELVGQRQVIILSSATRVGYWNLLNIAIELVHGMLNSALLNLEPDWGAKREGYLVVNVISNLFQEFWIGLVSISEWTVWYFKPWYV